MIQKKKHIVKPYNRRLIVVIGDKQKEFKKYFRKVTNGHNFDDEYWFASTIDGCTIEGGVEYSCVYIVLNTNNKHGEINNGTIAHECLHAIDMMFERIGTQHDPKNPEHTAYLLGYLVNLVHKELDEFKAKQK